MNRFAVHIFVALLTFAIGFVAFVGWNASQNLDSRPRASEVITCFIVQSVTSEDAALFDYDAYLNEHCVRRNPERQRLLEARLERQLRKSQR